MHKMTFYHLGNADCCRIDLANGKKLLFDYANMRSPDDQYDLRADLPTLLLDDLEAARRDYYDVVAITHLDDDHIRGAADFFWFEHDEKYQGEGRVKFTEMWVPAAVIIEDIDDETAKLLQAEARYRLIRNEGIRVFSRPEKLDVWLEEHASDLIEEEDLVIDAGRTVPGLSLEDNEVEFFVHSPFAEACDGELVDRNEGSLVFQVVFRAEGVDTRVILSADTPYDNLAAIVTITEAHARQHWNVDRLGWEVFKLPHHCSYLSLSSEKGKEKTQPVPEVARLFEEHSAPQGAIIVSTSDRIPATDTTQPPHRQAAKYYQDLTDDNDGEFVVTMEHPTAVKPEPLVIIIDGGGATRQKQISRGAATVTTQAAPRAG